MSSEIPPSYVFRSHPTKREFGNGMLAPIQFCINLQGNTGICGVTNTTCSYVARIHSGEQFGASGSMNDGKCAALNGKMLPPK